MSERPKVGTVIWRDLTVPDADRAREFYTAVIGWDAEPVEMGGYSDYNMLPPGTRDPVAGICFRRGVNADLPPQWLMYITVEDLDRSVARCTELGGRIVAGPRGMGEARYCVIQDPAGALCALFQPGA
jgi:uncharacterized protein